MMTAESNRRIASLALVLLVAILITHGLDGEVLKLNDPELLRELGEFDIDGDGRLDFHIYHIYRELFPGPVGGGPVALESLYISLGSHVEFLFDANGNLMLLEEEGFLGQSTADGVWSAGPLGWVVLDDSPYHSVVILNLTNAGSDPNVPSMLPQDWEAPFMRKKEGFIGFRIKENDEFSYGYIHMDLYRDFYLRSFDENHLKSFMFSSAYGDILSISYETAPGVPVQVVSLQEPKRYLTVDRVENGVLVDFSGTLQQSEDLQNWVDVDPPPVGPVLIDFAVEKKHFYRIKE